MKRQEDELLNPTINKLLWAVVIASVIFALTGCSTPRWESAKKLNPWDVACDIEYEAEPPYEDYWQPPEITLTTNKGDCEDKAIVLWWLMRHTHKVKHVYVVAGYVDQIFMRTGHAWVEVGDGPFAIIMDPTFEVILPRFMMSKHAYYKIDSKVMENRAKAFMKSTGLKDLNPLVGW